MLRNRYRRIVLFFARVILSFIWWDLTLPRFGLGRLSRRNREERMRRSASAFRALAIEMGGVMIKVGQFLSTRVDVLPPVVTAELSGLQDEVPPVPFEAIRQQVEAELGAPLEEKFAWFDPAPLAAASLGQAHRARITQKASPSAQAGLQDVVVKVQRPQIEEIITTDLSALRTVGGWLQRYRPISRRANVPALLAEFTKILYQEIDYLAEGRNAETFQTNFLDVPGVRVPFVYWSHTTRRVLTLENVWAIKITDYSAIREAGIDRGQVAGRLLDTYLQQIFEDGFFHADPHPGNLFVQPLSRPATAGEELGNASTPFLLTFVDFGMVGHVPQNLRNGLRETLIGVGTQDAARVVRSYQTLGILLPGADTTLLEQAEAKLFERYWGKTMTELSSIKVEEVLEFANEFRELVYALPFQIPQDIIFLARAVAILSGMCTGLDPQFNLWEHLAPYAQQLIAEEIRSGRQGPQAWLAEIGTLLQTLLSVPRKMDAILNKLERGDIAVQAPEVTRQVARLERSIRQVAGGIIFTGLLLGGVQLYMGDERVFGEVLLAAAGVSLLWVLVQGRRK